MWVGLALYSLLVVVQAATDLWGIQALRIAINGTFTIPLSDYSQTPVVLVSTPLAKTRVNIEVGLDAISISAKTLCDAEKPNVDTYAEIGLLIIQQGVYILPSGGRMLAKVVTSSQSATPIAYTLSPQYTGENFFEDDTGPAYVFLQSYGSSQETVTLKLDTATTYTYLDSNMANLGLLAFSSDTTKVELADSELLIGQKTITASQLYAMELAGVPQCGPPSMFLSHLNCGRLRYIVTETTLLTSTFKVSGLLKYEACPTSTEGSSDVKNCKIQYLTHTKTRCAALTDTYDAGSGGSTDIDGSWSAVTIFTAVLVVVVSLMAGGIGYFAWMKYAEKHQPTAPQVRRPGQASPYAAQAVDYSQYQSSPYGAPHGQTHLQPSGAMRPPGM